MNEKKNVSLKKKTTRWERFAKGIWKVVDIFFYKFPAFSHLKFKSRMSNRATDGQFMHLI